MLKKISLLVFFLFLNQSVIAKDIPVKIIPANKITTSTANIQEGDSVNFLTADDIFINSSVYIKKGTPVKGTITSIEDNDYLYVPATLYAENFVTKNVDGKLVKLSGIVYKAGNNHWELTQFIPIPFVYLRGGEVQIKPKKDTFILLLKEDAK